MSLFNKEVKTKISELLLPMKNNVGIALFTQEFECGSCAETKNFVEEISSLSEKISFSVYDFLKDSEKVKELSIERIPAIAILDAEGHNTNMKFYGLPGGYEINSFIRSLIEASGNPEELPAEIKKRIDKITKPVHIQVYVMLGCPHCPVAVSGAHRLALENKNIRADMIDSAVFPVLSNKYNVMGVPKIIINETEMIEGAAPIGMILDRIEKLLNKNGA